MQLIYTVNINEDISIIDSLHADMDRLMTGLGYDVTKSKLESPDKVSEKDYERN